MLLQIWWVHANSYLHLSRRKKIINISYINESCFYGKASVLHRPSTVYKQTQEKKNNIFVQNVQDRTCCLANTVLVESLKSVHCCVSSVSNVCFFPLFKLQIALALFAIFAVAAAKPQWLSPYAYSAYGGYNSPLLATPYAAGASPYIANYQYASPYSSAYSAFVPSAYSSSLVI